MEWKRVFVRFVRRLSFLPPPSREYWDFSFLLPGEIHISLISFFLFRPPFFYTWGERGGDDLIQLLSSLPKMHTPLPPPPPKTGTPFNDSKFPQAFSLVKKGFSFLFQHVLLCTSYALHITFAPESRATFFKSTIPLLLKAVAVSRLLQSFFFSCLLPSALAMRLKCAIAPPLEGRGGGGGGGVRKHTRVGLDDVDCATLQRPAKKRTYVSFPCFFTGIWFVC